jgi:hypothetical protein
MSPTLMPMRKSMRLSTASGALLSAIAAWISGRAAQGVDNAGELDQQPVAGCLDKAAAVLGDFRIEEFATQRSEAFEGAALVSADQPRIAGHIGGEDRRETAGRCHSSGSPAARIPGKYTVSHRSRSAGV